MEFKLAAFDMDGTLLDSNKKIREDSLNALRAAEKAGKFTCLSTGRNPAELTEYISQLPMMQYLMCISGSIIIDNRTKEIVYEKALDEKDLLKLFDLVQNFDVAVHVHGKDTSHFERKNIDRLYDYGMGQYTEMFKRVCVFHDDLAKEYKENPYPICKFNIHCKNLEVRDALEKEVAKLPISYCFAEAKSIECSPLGVSKASGLVNLCKYLGITIDEAIAVGDADNDIEILKTAGLGVAMGNANENVLNIADVVVSDCDSTGIKEVIENYLLK